MSELLGKSTVQFPLCLLASYSNTRDRIFSCMAWAVMTAGHRQLQELSVEEADIQIAMVPAPKAPKGFPKDQLRVVCLGRAFTGVLFGHADFPWDEFHRAERFVSQWKSKGLYQGDRTSAEAG